MARYENLKNYLNKLSTPTQLMTFKDVEDILGSELPKSAYKYAAWWANNKNPSRHSDYWLSAGWATEEVNISAQNVTFRFIGKKSVRKADENSIDEALLIKTKQSPITLDIETAKESLYTETVIKFKWQHLGSLRLDSKGQLVFPMVPACPGLYRFRLVKNNTPQHYIGETVELRRRFQQYRRPGSSQATNIRMNTLLTKHLESGNKINVCTINNIATLLVNNREVQANLSDKAIRRLIENAALLSDQSKGIETLNL